MDEFSVRLSLLLDITTKKKNILEIILNLTENQNCVALSALDKESRALFMELSNEKQKNIDEVYNLDIVFDRAYESIKDCFSNELSDETREKVLQLQNTIDGVMNLNDKICSIESINNDLLENKRQEVQKIDVPKADKNRVIDHYKMQANNFNKLNLNK